MQLKWFTNLGISLLNVFKSTTSTYTWNTNDYTPGANIRKCNFSIDCTVNRVAVSSLFKLGELRRLIALFTVGEDDVYCI